MSLLCKYVPDLTHIISYSSLDLREDLSYDEYAVEIPDQQEKKLRNRSIPYVKVLWSNHEEREVIWEIESTMREHFPYLFGEPSWDKDFSFVNETLFKEEMM